MGTYAAGDATKNRIKAVARPLFYKQGPAAVTDTLICREAEVQRGLVGYHFGGHGGLVAAVYRDYVESLRNAVSQKFPTDCPMLSYCILEYLLIDLLHRDMNMRRLYVEMIQYPEVSDEEVRVQHEQIARILSLDPGEVTGQLKAAVALTQGGFNELIRCIDTEYLDGDLDELIRIDLMMSMTLMGVDTSRSTELVEETKHLIAGYRIAIGPALSPRVISA